MQAIEQFYSFLNFWGVEDVHGQIDDQDEFMFDREKAIETEDQLRDQTDSMFDNLKYIKTMLTKVQIENK